MKPQIFLYLLLLIIFACKKDKKTVTAPINHSEKVKTIRISYFNNGAIHTKSEFTYHYDGFNRLNHVSIFDSNLVSNQWLTRKDDSLAVYQYNASNKIIKIVQKSMNYSVDHLYDTDQFLTMSFEKFEDGRVDTIFYSKNGNMIIMNSFTYDGLKRSFYVTNIDSVLIFDSNNYLKERTINTFNSKKNLSYAYYNAFFSYTNRDEIISSTRTQYGSGTSMTETTIYSYTYDQQNYPITFTAKIDGNVKYIYTYTYY